MAVNKKKMAENWREKQLSNVILNSILEQDGDDSLVILAEKKKENEKPFIIDEMVKVKFFFTEFKR